MISNTSDEQKNVDQIILIDDDEYINDSDVEEIDSGEEEEFDSDEEEEFDSDVGEFDSDTDTVILEVEEHETNNNTGPLPILRRERHVDYLTPVRNSQNHEVSIVDISKITSRRRLVFN